MPNYAPELAASVLHQYVHTDKPIAQIAADHEINERDVTRIRHAAGCPPRGKRVRAIPPAMQLLLETAEQLKADNEVGRNKRGEAERIAPDDAGGAMRCAYCALRTHTEPAPPFSDASAIARIERLIGEELAAQEATRASLGSLARAPTEAERCARTLSTLTQTLQTLMRLRAGNAPEQGTDDDADLPADADECRNELARRIEAFLESREADEDAECAPGAATVAG
jgi:hypothetical protein